MTPAGDHPVPTRTPTRAGKGWLLRGAAAGPLLLGLLSIALPNAQAAPPLARAGVAPLSANPAGGYDAAQDLGSLHHVTRLIGADQAWRQGWTGAGVDVAVIDTGVSPVPGLTSGNVLAGPDLSLDRSSPGLTMLDGYGHGTHMAGIIAGRDQARTPAGYADAGPDEVVGVAPDARIISVKVGAADGAVEVAQVVAAVEWVTEHARSGGLDIKVLSLSYGTEPQRDSGVDPLGDAVERAWEAGIVVVVAGGNDGQDSRSLTSPATTPLVLAVGALDPQGTQTYDDDTVPDFASRGDGRRHVDLVAPGAHVAGLAVPGSVLAREHADALVCGDRFLRGSGTSQATAVTAGAAALLLQRYPGATPDQVKRQLTSTARPFAASAVSRGSGALDVAAALTRPLSPAAGPVRSPATGTRSLDGDPGWTAKTWTAKTWTAKTWTAKTWTAKTWTADIWG